MKPFISMLVVAAALLLAGCKGLESQLVGTWKGPANQNVVLKEDKSFEIGTGQQALGGKWSVTDDKTVKLDVVTIGGKPKDAALADLMKMAAALLPKDKLEEQKKRVMDQLNNMSLAYDKDKKTLSLAGPGGAPAVFTKEGA